MAHREFRVDSNAACTDRDGVYDGWVYATGSNGVIAPPFTVDLGRTFSSREEPATIFNWVHRRLAYERDVENQYPLPKSSVAAMVVTRFCISPSHLPEKDEKLHRSRRRELVMQILLAKEGEEPFEPVKLREADFDEAGIGYIARQVVGINMKGGGVLLPKYTASDEEFATTGAIELAPPTRHPIYGALRGDEFVITPSHLEDAGYDRC